MESRLSPPISADEQGLVEQTAALRVDNPLQNSTVTPGETQDGVSQGEESSAPASTSTSTTPASSSTPTPGGSQDPRQNDLKRSDPFMFGSRYLTEEDNVYEFNAWDHVETDDTYKEYAEQQYEMQRQSPVSDFDKNRLNNNPARMWDLFYKNNTSNFFKNRKWLRQEFPILGDAIKPDAGPTVILEVGAGAGNTAFPLLAENQNPELRIHACDYSKKAVEVMRSHEGYDEKYMRADVWDLSSTDAEACTPPGLAAEASVDIVVLIFVFSALAPSQWAAAVRNVHRLLKPGGVVCFRDYGRGDLAQVRFKKGRYLDENFYVRGDGTRVYFFEQEELGRIWSGKLNEGEGTSTGKADGSTPAPDEKGSRETTGDSDPEGGAQPSWPAFDIEELGTDRRLLVNRQRKLKMYRCWMQGRFRKKQD